MKFVLTDTSQIQQRTYSINSIYRIGFPSDNLAKFTGAVHSFRKLRMHSLYEHRSLYVTPEMRMRRNKAPPPTILGEDAEPATARQVY